MVDGCYAPKGIRMDCAYFLLTEIEEACSKMSLNRSAKKISSSESKEIYEKGVKAVLDYDIETAKKWAEEIIKESFDPGKAIEKGLVRGIRIIGEMFDRKEIFLPELVSAAEVVKAGLEILLPEVKKSGKEWKSSGKVLIGTVAGDIHDIGKNIVMAMLVSEGFEVHDLGIDVQTEKFIEKVRELKPDILGLSALLSTTIISQKDVIETLKKEGLRDRVKVLVGGLAVTQEWASKIGADGYGMDYKEALKKAKGLMKMKTRV